MNINDQASVTLSSRGASIYNEWASQYPSEYRPAYKNAGDSLKDSLWHIMQVFGGDKIGLGMLSPFEEGQMEVC